MKERFKFELRRICRAICGYCVSGSQFKTSPGGVMKNISLDFSHKMESGFWVVSFWEWDVVLWVNGYREERSMGCEAGGEWQRSRL